VLLVILLRCELNLLNQTDSLNQSTKESTAVGFQRLNQV
jgi:hypothetical protein